VTARCEQTVRCHRARALHPLVGLNRSSWRRSGLGKLPRPGAHRSRCARHASVIWLARTPSLERSFLGTCAAPSSLAHRQFTPVGSGRSSRGRDWAKIEAVEKLTRALKLKMPQKDAQFLRPSPSVAQSGRALMALGRRPASDDARWAHNVLGVCAAAAVRPGAAQERAAVPHPLRPDEAGVRQPGPAHP